MSKSKKISIPNLPAAVLLRPRLDALCHQPALTQQSEAEIRAALDALARGVKPDLFLPTLISAWQAAPASAQARLATVIPNWLRERGHMATLQELAARNRLDAELRGTASAWLSAIGVTLPPPAPIATDLFFQAYDLDNGMQGSTLVLWYVSEKKNRLYGMSVLYDHNPPWDGAVKDILVIPKGDPRDTLRRFVDIWATRGETMAPISGSAAKTKILKSLYCNRASNIRLPRDLISQRDAFMQFVLALPNASNTPTFTDAEWDFLRANGQSPESLSRHERTQGYRTRTEDGKEILVFGDSGDWKDYF
ncbi:MAG: hypothetical protein HY327_00665 [Chloroflexi bacterium]|nr:hypothetical protein [Chloroflexota bacterium]